MWRSSITVFCTVGFFFTSFTRTVSAPAKEAQIQYFRSDHGISPWDSALPDDLNLPESLRWRVPLDSGHSTPVIVKGRIFLTTFNGGTLELATVALRESNG